MVEEKSPSFKLIVFSAETLNWRMPMVAAIYIYIQLYTVCMYIYIYIPAGLLGHGHFQS